MTKTLTFAETLHPEDAAVSIDPENRGPKYGYASAAWTALYDQVHDTPIAVLVAEQERRRATPKPTSIPHASQEETNVQEGAPKDEEEEDISDTTRIGYGCFGLEGFIGLSLTFSAVLAAFTIEMCSALVYCLAAFFYWIRPSHRFFTWLGVVFMLIAQMLLLVDAVLLSANVLVTEIIAFVACLCTACFGWSYVAGHTWHMYVRKVCHLTRGAFRGFHEGWQPERIFPIEILFPANATVQQAQVVLPNDLEEAEYTVDYGIVIVDSKDSTAASNPK